MEPCCGLTYTQYRGMLQRFADMKREKRPDTPSTHRL